MAEQIDRGSIVEKRVKEYGISNTMLAKKLGYSRTAVVDWFKKEDLAFDIIHKIGGAIRFDFSQDIPELKMYRSDLLLAEEPEGQYHTKLAELKLELSKWKNEAYQATKELSELKDKYYALLLEKEKKAEA